MAAFLIVSCSEDSTVSGGKEDIPTPPAVETRGTEVYVQGQLQGAAYTRAASVQTEQAYFFIRIDNSDEEEQTGLPDASNYWPQTYDGQSVFAPGNEGLVDVSYPYFKTSAKYSQYVFDTTGEATLKALVQVPSIDDLVAANRNTSLDLSKINLDEYKVIWYVVKKSYGKWHVDGLLTKKSTSDAAEVLPDIKEDNKDLDNSADTPALPEVGQGDGNVEVDVHQQEHSTWDEIKTSIHVRDLVDSVKVEIPIEYANLAETDDFNLRSYDFALESKVYINRTEYDLSDTNPVNVTVEHRADRIVITVKAINKDYITALRKEYGDGLTVEVHSYPQNLSKEQIWSRVKLSTAKVWPESYQHLLFPGATNAFGL